MMWAMRRQLSGVVKYCWPASCWPAATSHSRNSALRRPSGCRVTRPVTSACALMVRQSGNRGTASTLAIFSRNAAGSIGANRPLRLRLAAMIWETPCAVSLSPGAPPRKSGIAMGIGWTLPWVISTVTAAAGHGAIAKPASAAPPATSAWRRLTHANGVRPPARMFGISRSLRSTTEDVLWIEVDVDFLPQIVRGQRKHVVRLALDDGAPRAVAGGFKQRTVAASQYFRLTDEPVVTCELDANGDDILIRMDAHGGGGSPQ